MKRLRLILIIISLLAATASAQEKSSTDKKPSATPTPAETDKRPENTDVSEAKQANTNETAGEYGEGKHWSVYLTFSGVFDSNINHDLDDLDDYGAVGGVGVYYRNRAKNPNFEFEYEIGRQEYKNTSMWDRTSHNMRAWSENQLGKKWISTTTGEISLKGSTEDRELTNRYSATQFFQYRLTSNNRFNFGGAYRLKRFDTDGERRNSTNPYLETGYERRFSKGKRKVEVSYRYEENNARDERFDYIRNTYGAEFVTPLFRRGRLDLEARYRPQKYSRLVEIELPNGDEIDVPRRDKRWIYAADYRYPLSRALELGLIYKYEQRNSNDPDRNFKAHAAGVVLTYRWWK